MSSTITLPPNARVLLNSMRCVGYTPESAIADIIDNSISARANRISVCYENESANTTAWIAICDDGCGMSRDTLLNGMKFGSRCDYSENDERDIRDLGRYGLGLKTASLSQCTKFTVFSWQDKIGHAFCWDLKYVGDNWTIQELDLTDIQNHSILNRILDRLNDRRQNPYSPDDHGTIVLWENMDRNNLQKDALDASMLSVREHISLVFHRFLKREDNSPLLHIDLNGSDIKPDDPFASDDCRRDKLPPDSCWSDNTSLTTYQPYLIPRDDKYAGRSGFIQNQGFYIYRNKRLIQKATWLRLLQKEPSTQLLRVQLDVSANHDSKWLVDVKKSQVTPPADVKRWLEHCLPQAYQAARRTYNSHLVNLIRSKHKDETAPGCPWLVTQDKQGIYHYKINANHELLQLIKKEIPKDTCDLLKQYLDNLVAMFPYEYCKLANEYPQPQEYEEPCWEDDAAIRLIEKLKGKGKSSSEIKTFMIINRINVNPEIAKRFLP